jgi:hypothetical protein
MVEIDLPAQAGLLNMRQEQGRPGIVLQQFGTAPWAVFGASRRKGTMVLMVVMQGQAYLSQMVLTSHAAGCLSGLLNSR